MYLRTACRQFGGGRRRVLRDRNAAERGQHLGQHRAIERNAGDGEAGGDRRMRVDDRTARRAAGGRPRGASASRTTDRDRPDSFFPSRSVMHIMSGVMNPLQTLFGVISRRSVAEPDADVAVVRRGIGARVHAAADFDDVGAQRGFGGHAERGDWAIGFVLDCARYLSRQSVEQKYTALRTRRQHDGPSRERRTCRTPDRAPSGRRAAARAGGSAARVRALRAMPAQSFATDRAKRIRMTA